MIGQFNMPSYVSVDMSKMLPAEIVRKQGARVLDSKKSLAELLKDHGAE